MEVPQKYVLVIRAESLDEAVEETLHLAYVFVMRALHERRLQGINGPYEDFALQLLALLQQHRGAYTTH